MMTTTITIPPELAQLATAKAMARGMSLEQFVEDAIRRMAELPDPWELFADVRAEVEASGVTEEELEAQINAAVREVRASKRGE